MYRKILIPTDGSPRSETAVKEGVQLAGILNAEVVVYHVISVAQALSKNGRYDLIIMASRGLGEIKGYLLGSVSNRVVRHAGCSVLIIK
ncbi:MAG: universal stress protein [Desulfocucumaceae bacterium]